MALREGAKGPKRQEYKKMPQPSAEIPPDEKLVACQQLLRHVNQTIPKARHCCNVLHLND